MAENQEEERSFCLVTLGRERAAALGGERKSERRVHLFRKNRGGGYEERWRFSGKKRGFSGRVFD